MLSTASCFSPEVGPPPVERKRNAFGQRGKADGPSNVHYCRNISLILVQTRVIKFSRNCDPW